MLSVMQLLAEAHFTVLAISLRAQEIRRVKSTISVGAPGMMSRRLWSFFRRNLLGDPIFIVGRSMGAATAIFAAGGLKGQVAGYFLEQPYKDLDSATWNRLQHYLPPILDWIAYGGLRLWAPAFLPAATEQISPYDHIEDIPESVPVVFVTGSADRHAHLDEVTAMYRRIESHAKLVIFDGAEHVDLDRADSKLYRTTLLNFLDRPRGETKNRTVNFREHNRSGSD